MLRTGGHHLGPVGLLVAAARVADQPAPSASKPKRRNQSALSEGTSPPGWAGRGRTHRHQVAIRAVLMPSFIQVVGTTRSERWALAACRMASR